MSKKGGFGSAKPLAGQSGYKVSESDVLDKEAREMEIRLRNLQDKMKMQQLEDESISRPGGSRWGSARADKGSINNYGKEVREKQMKATSKGKTKVNLLTGEVVRNPSASASATTISNDPSKYASSSSSNTATVSSPPRQHEDERSDVLPFQTVIPMDWGVAEVSDWLCSMSLAQYVEAFATNEMTGVVLLDISLEDLDYLGITKLAHRKTIVKAVEELRLSFSDPNMGPAELTAAYAGIYQKHGLGSPAKALMSRSMGGLPKAPAATNVQAGAPGNYQHHWSHLEPLSSNPAKNEPMLPNGADEEGVAGYANDVLDEEAEKAAFSEAVMAWRNAGKVTVSAQNLDQNQNQGLGQAPASSLAGMGGGSSFTMSDSPTKDGAAEEWVNPWDNPASEAGDVHSDLFGTSEKKHTQIIRPAKRTEKADSSTVTLGGGTIVAQGGSTSIVREPMSEEAERLEREEFKKAVMEWRSSSGSGGSTQAEAKSVAGSSNTADGTGNEPDMVKGSLLDQKQRNVELTEKLKRDMDAKYEENARQLEVQKQRAREQMEKASAELEEARRTRLKSSAGAKNSFEGMDDDCGSPEGGEAQVWRDQDQEDYEYVSSPGGASPSSRSIGDTPGSSGYKQGGRHGTPASVYVAVEPVASPKPKPALELLASYSLAEAKGQPESDEPVQYDVEEPSDEE